MTGERFRLAAAVLISAGVHGAVWVGLTGTPMHPIEPQGRTGLPLQVALVQADSYPQVQGKSAAPARREPEPPVRRAPPPEAPAAAPPPQTAAPARARRTEARQPVNHEAGARQDARSAEPARAEDAAKAAVHQPAGEETAASAKALQTQLNDALARQFYYPPMAIRRGWEGRVLLELDITPDGHVGGVEIVAKSGHPVLDRAAVDAADRIGRLPGAAPWLGGTTRRLKLPVIYVLRES